jgi:hypothetical protein
MIIRRLINMIRRDPPAHQVPQELRDLDRAMQPVVSEQQDAITLAKAREALLANPGQPSVVGSIPASRPRAIVARKHWIPHNAARVTIGTGVLVGIVSLIMWAVPMGAPTVVPASNLRVLDYGVRAQPDVGTCDPKVPIHFALTVRASGSGTVDYTWQPDKSLASQPVRKTMTFTADSPIQQVDYTVPRSSGQHIQGGMTVVITAPDSPHSPLGATYDKYSCDGSRGNDGTHGNTVHSPSPGSNGGL